MRRDAWFRRRPGLFCLRVADGSPWRGVRCGSDRGTAAQCAQRGIGDADGTGRRFRSSGGRAAAAGSGRADARIAAGGARYSRPAGRCVECHPRRGRGARDRIWHRDQECRLLRGVRRLFDGTGTGRAHRWRSGGVGTDGGGRSGPGPGHAASADRAQRAGHRPGDRTGRGYLDLLCWFDLGVQADLCHRWRGQGCLRSRSSEAGSAR